MRRRAWLALAAFCCACSHSGVSSMTDGSGFSTTDGGVSSLARRICDGSQGIRFMYRIEVDVSREPAFAAILYELGYDFLFVDGTCHFFVMAPSSVSDTVGDPLSPWRPYRQGVLSADQEKRLHDLVGYDNITADGPPCVLSGNVVDSSPTTIWDGATTYVCAGILKNIDYAWPLRSELYMGGMPMAGGLRIEVGQDSVPDQKMYTWPLAQPATAYELPYVNSLMAGQGTLISDQSDTAALRNVRDQFVTDSTGVANFFGLLLLEPKGWVLSIRDELPFAQQNGLWTLPPNKAP